MAMKSNDDCFFYYNSHCSKGYDCQFRHEAAARNSDTVCYYWKTVGCTRLHCTYRHQELTAAGGGQERKVKQCFWERQPSGCQKIQCPFLHTEGKPVQKAVTQKAIDSGSIIVNKHKLESLQHIIPVKHVVVEQEDDSKPRRIVVPPGTGGIARRAVTGGIKNRLGKLGEVKSRLGTREDVEGVLDESHSEEGLEQELRESAIQTIDLRNRLHSKKPVRECVEVREKKVKKPKKDTIKKLKKKKKRKERSSEDRVSARLEVDLPSASDYSDLDTPNGSPDLDLITVMSKTSGMYADTKELGTSAKIRLGKRKAENGNCDRPLSDRIRDKRVKSEIKSVLEELKSNQIDELQLKPLRTLEESSPCRNPSPPSRSCSSPSSRSPSPSPSPPSSSPNKMLLTKFVAEKLVTKKKKKDKVKKNKKSKKGEKKKSKKSDKPGREEKKRLSSKRDNSPSPSKVLKAASEPDENSSPSKKAKQRTEDAVLETRTVRVREDKEALDTSGKDILQQLDDLINE